MGKCKAVQHSDQMVCEPCRLAWDTNDPHPPECRSEQRRAHSGPTLRDRFAMAAMQGILSDSESFYHTFGELAGDCYSIADAMLREREK